MNKQKKGKYLLIIGIVCLIISFVCMVLSKTSTGDYLILAGVSGALIFEGIHIKNKNDK